MSEQISINRALAEIKLLDKRIRNQISTNVFIASKKKSADKINRLYFKEEFDKGVKANYQSVKDLIERRNKIKSAIVESNAKTIVEVAGNEYSVADAIERKSNIVYDQLMLEELKRQFRSIQSQVSSENERVQGTLDTLLETMVGKDNIKNIDIQSNDFAKKYLEENEYEIINPLDIEKVIKELEDGINDFLFEVDYILSESNTITKIEI